MTASESDVVRVAVAQTDPETGDNARNVARIEELVAEAANTGARLLVLPECAISGYLFDDIESCAPFAERIPGPATGRLEHACTRWGMHLVIGILEQASPMIQEMFPASAGGKGIAACPAVDDGPHRIVLGEALGDVGDLAPHGEADRIAHLGPIEDHRGDAAVALHQDLVAHACLLGCRSGRRHRPVDVVDVAGIVPDLPSPSPNFGGRWPKPLA